MNEYQKQAIADAKIKLANIAERFKFADIINGRAYLKRSLNHIEGVSTTAHESVQNGTCDEVAK